MQSKEKEKEVKQTVYLLAMIWVLDIAILAYRIYSNSISYDILPIIALLPIAVTPAAMVGLWKFKKWGLILGYVLAIMILIISLISFNIIALLFWAVVLYYLYKLRNTF